MYCFEQISSPELIWKKLRGCYFEFGAEETFRRIGKEIFRFPRANQNRLDVSFITTSLAIGAAPKSLEEVENLKKLKLNQAIDLRAERKNSDILNRDNNLTVHWVPTYDDWGAKPAEFFEELLYRIESSLNGSRTIFICCGAGEHRAPLGGAVALLYYGYSLAEAVSLIRIKRPVAEFLPVYISSLEDFLRFRKLAEPHNRNGKIDTTH